MRDKMIIYNRFTEYPHAKKIYNFFLKKVLDIFAYRAYNGLVRKGKRKKREEKNTMKHFSENANDCGRWGDATEMDLKDFFNQIVKVAAQGKVDFKRGRKCYEVKTGAGELDYVMRTETKYIIVVPVVDETLSIEKQEGFVLETETFRNEIVKVEGLVRYGKKATDGTLKTTLQTFWNHKKNAPHGKLLERYLDMLYENCLMTFEEYLENGGRLD